MVLITRELDHILAALFFSTIAWTLAIISTGLDEWRVWYMDDPLFLYTRVAFVGMWEACVYHPDITGSAVKKCYGYERPIPLDIHFCQYFLQTSRILGLLGHVCTISTLINRILTGRAIRGTYNPFFLPGIINVIASGCVFLAVMINYNAVMKMMGIDFPSYIPLPFKPDTQNIGNALIMAGISSFLFMLSGNIFFIYPRHN